MRINSYALITVFSDREMEFLSNVIESQDGITELHLCCGIGVFWNKLMLKGKYVVHIKYILSKNVKYPMQSKVKYHTAK